MALKEVLQPWSARLAIGVSLLLALAMATVPLLGIHGAESAVLLGVVLPPFAALAAARLVLAHRRRASGVAAPALLGQGLLGSLMILLGPLVLLGLNALRVRNCAPWEGLLFMLLGPTAGVVLASCSGMFIASAVKHERLASWLAPMPPLLGIAVAVYRFYTTPAIFAYGHFFGYFHGTIYDTGVSIPDSLWTLRGITVALLGLLVAVLVLLFDRQRTRLVLDRPRKTQAAAVLATLGVASGIAAEAYGPELGHRTSPAWIRAQLGDEVRGKRCTLVVPTELDAARVDELVDDCDYRVRELEAWFGIRQQRRLTAYFFRSRSEKRRLMGAARVFIAKPWRHEIYLQAARWPHPVLAHEVAHIIAGNIAPGPFAVAGDLGGLWPNPALIEGVAVAAAWNANDDMTPHQWSRAMLELKLAPSLQRLLGTSFLGQPKRRAYTVSGSVMRFVHERYGAGAVRRAYASGDLAEAVGKPLAELRGEWRRFVTGVELPERARDLARVRFQRGNVFSSVCPHELARLRDRLRAHLARAHDARVIEICQRILDISAAEVGVRAALVGALARQGELAQAEAQMARLIGPPAAPQPVIVAAEEAMADAAWMRGDIEEAGRRYRVLLARPQTLDAIRQIQVKSYAVEGPAEARRLLRQLLLQGGGRGPDAIEIITRLTGLLGDGLPDYLEARQWFFRHHYARAANLMTTARAQGLPSREIRIESIRMEGIARFATGELNLARELWESLRDAPEARYRAQAKDFLRRIRLTQPSPPSAAAI